MSEKKFEGSVIAEVFELRFASSGKLTQLNKKLGDFVSRGEIIASLDKNYCNWNSIRNWQIVW